MSGLPQAHAHLLAILLAVSLAHRSCVCSSRRFWLQQFHIGIRSGVQNRKIIAAFKVYGHELHWIESRMFKLALVHLHGTTSKP